MVGNRKTGLKLGAVAVLMLGFSYALVPLYDMICDITGLNGKTGVITSERADSLTPDKPDALTESPGREVLVEFLSHINQSGAWRFTPEKDSLRVRPGKQYTVRYIATNLRQTAAVAQAVPSVAPVSAAAYFNKVECFCFTRQAFEGDEQRPLLVTFVVDPNLPEQVRVISLAYTIFDVTEQPENDHNV